MLTEEEAQLSAIAFITAMLNDDKESRELIYQDYDAESLKRMMRWVARFHWPFIGDRAAKGGTDFKKFWSLYATQLVATLENKK